MSKKANMAYMTEKEILPTRIRELMEDTSTTQQVLGNAISCTRQTVSDYANGQSTPDAKALYKIARYFNVSTDYLLGLSDCPCLDEDIKRVCKYTGLSSEAVKLLHYLTLENAENSISDVPANNKLNIDLLNRVLGDEYGRYKADVEKCDTNDLQPVKTVFYDMERYINAREIRRELSHGESEELAELEECSECGNNSLRNFAETHVTINGEIPETLPIGSLYCEHLATRIRNRLSYFSKKQYSNSEE